MLFLGFCLAGLFYLEVLTGGYPLKKSNSPITLNEQSKPTLLSRVPIFEPSDSMNFHADGWRGLELEKCVGEIRENPNTTLSIIPILPTSDKQSGGYNNLLSIPDVDSPAKRPTLLPSLVGNFILLD